MKDYLSKLKSKIEADPLTFYDGGDIPALESLYFHYTECYCIHPRKTGDIFGYLLFLYGIWWIMGLERRIRKHAGGMFSRRGRVPQFENAVRKDCGHKPLSH